MNFPANPRKATDAVARLIEHSGADVDYLRVIKLIYLADRESILARGIPIVGGRYYSMRKGPVITDVMDFVNCCNAPGWKQVISRRRGNSLNLVAKPTYQTLTESEIEILDSTVAKHFNRSTDDLVAWCHENCGEYEHVLPWQRKPIAIETMLRKEGRSEAQAAKLTDRAQELAELHELLG